MLWPLSHETMTTDGACFILYLRDISPCSDRCHETMTTDRPCFILQGYITMFWPLSWDDDKWRSMFHTWRIRYHVLTVDYDSWPSMFHTWGGYHPARPLSLDDDNWQSMLHILGMNNHALSVVMRRWKLTEHVSYTREILPCSDRCHKTMTTDGACFILEGYFNILWPLSWDNDSWRSMFHTWGIFHHVLTVVMRRWQLTEHVSYLWNTLLCSNRCHETMVTDRAWFIPQGWITMLWLLSLDDDN